jgi:hypothetical protein
MSWNYLFPINDGVKDQNVCQFLHIRRFYCKTSAFLHFNQNYVIFLHEFYRELQTKELLHFWIKGSHFFDIRPIYRVNNLQKS